MKDKIIDILQEANLPPYLFVGSGFSRRYINLPDWKELLKRFCKSQMDYDRLLSISNSNLTILASNLAKEFAQRWWTEDIFEESRQQASSLMNNESSPLKFEICKFLKGMQNNINNDYKYELDSLKGSNIEGVITTNWDCFIESIFPEHDVYIGQRDLIFSDIQGVSEIYKIHGCSSNHNSLILKNKDYKDFNDLNPYLASKIITIFMEHPIIFIGYSISDPNIQDILLSISKIIPSEKQGVFSKNLIFLNRSKGKGNSVNNSFYQFNGRSVPVTTIETDDYSIVYDAIGHVKRKIPVKYLRLFKSELHEIVRSSNPKDKIFVVDEDKLDKNSKVQFVVGVGVATEKLAERGYKGIKIIDLYKDLILQDEGFNTSLLLKEIPHSIAVGSRWIPVFKYLKAAGIKQFSQINDEKLKKYIPKSSASEIFYAGGFYKIFIESQIKRKSNEIIESEDIIKAAKVIPYLPIQNIDFEGLLNFMKNNFDLFKDNPNQTIFRKLACFYDLNVNGKDFNFND